MATLKDLRNRIKSVKSTQKITKAMKMVAAAKLRKAQDRAEKGRPYSDKMNVIITNLKNSITDIDSAPKLLVGNKKSQKHLCIVMTADRGLCGGFNTNICRRARLFFNEALESGKELKIITIGSKGHDQIKRVFGKYQFHYKHKCTYKMTLFHQCSKCPMYIKLHPGTLKLKLKVINLTRLRTRRDV